MYARSIVLARSANFNEWRPSFCVTWRTSTYAVWMLPLDKTPFINDYPASTWRRTYVRRPIFAVYERSFILYSEIKPFFIIACLFAKLGKNYCVNLYLNAQVVIRVNDVFIASIPIRAYFHCARVRLLHSHTDVHARRENGAQGYIPHGYRLSHV
jgi:hypothetical protein